MLTEARISLKFIDYGCKRTLCVRISWVRVLCHCYHSSLVKTFQIMRRGTVLGGVRLLQVPFRASWNAYFLLFPPFAILLIASLMILSLRPEILLLKSSASAHNEANVTNAFQLNVRGKSKESHECVSCSLPCASSLENGCECNSTYQCSNLYPPPLQIKTKASPYHNWELFNADYQEMLKKFKIFVYQDVSMDSESSPFSSVFLPHRNPLDPKIGNYFSEHAFKLALLKSSLLTHRPEEAHFFFMPFSINVMRNHPLLHSASSIPNFVADYVLRISSEFRFWNASGGADHFFVCCHSVGREAVTKHFGVRNNAIQVTCSSSYFQRLYTEHKDIALPQIWPRQHDEVLNPPNARTKLVFFAGRVQNSRIRQELLKLWQNDTSFSIFSGHAPFSYAEGFRRSKYCLHLKGYEVNTARVSDAIHYGCIPVVISDYYDLPFANILDWSKFSIVVNERDVARLKYILTSVSERRYLNLYQNLCKVREHFTWHVTPASYDAFHMTAYQLWLRRGVHRLVA
ncbi:Acetylglucosaminyltransferase EXT1/exostosin 1 [Handroanthus impetiginosus]|uniref:Acetylglucosaminyltransferase EXT1/exostosin 1 n=1 Tax=Handroanthus impetiginosus TaxID=429701 RepID=A0A2G9H8W4_9LAMI|nr:Acetylglucosaminyltransferase EXT1/exostosin 1 [Handroanthus impetiginosus]